MKNGWISDAIGLAGVALALLPWILLKEPGVGAVVLTCAGAVCAGISRADSLSSMLGRGNPGNDLIRDIWKRISNWTKRD